MALNDSFDRLPRSHLRLGDAVLPTYLVLGLAGVTAGIVGLSFVALLARLSVLVALAMVPISAATMVLLVFLRRLITGVETLVLLEQFGAVLTASTLALHLSGVPARPYLDALTVGLAVFLVFGRIGCLMSGCCFGRASTVGVSYPPECGHSSRVRRLPIQLIESAVWMVLAVDAAVLAVTRRDGSAVAATLIGYGIVRLAVEPLRDDDRGRWFGATEGQWLSVAAIVVGVTVAEDRRPPPAVAWLAAVAVLLLIVLVATAPWWLALDRGLTAADRASIRALAAPMNRARLDARVRTWKAGAVVFAASAVESDKGKRLIVSVSSTGRPLVRAEAAQALATLFDALGARPTVDLIALGNGTFAVDMPLALGAARAAEHQ